MSKLVVGFVFFTLLFFSSCNFFQKKNSSDTTTETPTEIPLAITPAFNSDSAYHFVKTQVDFGPRSPNTAAHEKCAAWITAIAHLFADTTFVQSYDAIGFDGKILKSKNIIATFNPAATTRVFISAHWDTRPFADQDEKDQDKPIDGANDAGSGVGVLLEAARAIAQQKPTIGVDLIFFDSEDYGQPAESKLPKVEDSYCLGSQYWAKHPHVPSYKADFGINLDMVGSADAVFVREQVSVQYADWVSQYVWNLAARLGFSSLFQNRLMGSVTDDHYYVNQILHIPTIDIIHYSENGFGSYWHTHNDNMSVINKETLGMVGRVVLQTIYQYNSHKYPPAAAPK